MTKRLPLSSCIDQNLHNGDLSLIYGHLKRRQIPTISGDSYPQLALTSASASTRNPTDGDTTTSHCICKAQSQCPQSHWGSRLRQQESFTMADMSVIYGHVKSVSNRLCARGVKVNQPPFGDSADNRELGLFHSGA